MDWLKKAESLAYDTLKENESLLLDLSHYLSNKRSIKKKEIEKLIKKTSENLLVTLKNNTKMFYRKKLKLRISGKLNINHSLKQNHGGVISLNKKS
jgi:hypothetical protein